MSNHTNYSGRGEAGGKNLVLDQLATLRGRTRRSDADGVDSLVPYFPGLVGGGNLIVFVEGASPHTVALPDPDLQSVLSALNDQLNEFNVRAYDDGGCIALQILLNQAITGSEYLEVRGGTGAAALGFDLAFGPLRAWPGGVSGGPEARIGSSELSAFVNLGEGLNSRTINRALTRVATNTDLHDASLSTPTLRILEVGTLSGATQITSGNYGILQITAAQPVGIYTGLDALNGYSTADELAPFFSLMEGTGVSAKMSASRVVAVGLNSITGPPPYGDASLVTDIGNVLGRSLRRSGTSTILDIPEGNLVRAASDSFSDVQVGDLAYISAGSGSFSKAALSNARNPWVVEAVGAAPGYDQVKLRCLSPEEWNAVGGTDLVLTSLDTRYEASESFGLIRFETGFFTSSNLLRIVISPPISAGTTLRLLAATRSTFPSIGEARTNLFPISKGLSDEIARALVAESAIDGRVTTEVNRAVAAEAVLRAADLSAGQKSTLTGGVNADFLHTHANTGAAVNHTHPQSDITSLSSQMAVLAGGAGSNADGYHTHTMPGGVPAALVGGAGSDAQGYHTHGNKSNTGHGHAISEVSGLQGALDGKASTSHTHGASGSQQVVQSVDVRSPGLWLFYGGEGGGNRYIPGQGWMSIPTAGNWMISMTSDMYFYTGWNAGTNYINFELTFNAYGGAQVVRAAFVRECAAEWFIWRPNWSQAMSLTAGTYYWSFKMWSSWGSYEMHGGYWGTTAMAV